MSYTKAIRLIHASMGQCKLIEYFNGGILWGPWVFDWCIVLYNTCTYIRKHVQYLFIVLVIPFKIIK